jgi:hypothetical protein
VEVCSFVLRTKMLVYYQVDISSIIVTFFTPMMKNLEMEQEIDD